MIKIQVYSCTACNTYWRVVLHNVVLRVLALLVLPVQYRHSVAQVYNRHERHTGVMILYHLYYVYGVDYSRLIRYKVL